MSTLSLINDQPRSFVRNGHPSLKYKGNGYETSVIVVVF